MALNRLYINRTFRRDAFLVVTAGVIASVLIIVGGGAASAAVGPVPLGTADSFVVLAGTGVAATGPNTLNGDLGTFPNTAITGSGSITVNGTDHGGDLVTQQAKTDLTTAFVNAAGQGPTSPIVADLAGQTLTAGVYNAAATLNLTGALTLDAAGDANALFVFQATSDLIVGSDASIVLINGAQACNVTWVVTSSASLGTNASFRGNILALTSITMNTGATLEGRALARNGTVTLDSNTITKPICTVVAPAAVTPKGGVATGDGSTASTSAPVGAGLAIAAGFGTLVLVGVLAGRSRRRDRMA